MTRLLLIPTKLRGLWLTNQLHSLRSLSGNSSVPASGASAWFLSGNPNRPEQTPQLPQIIFSDAGSPGSSVTRNAQQSILCCAEVFLFCFVFNLKYRKCTGVNFVLPQTKTRKMENRCPPLVTVVVVVFGCSASVLHCY